ncbi:MAG: GTPase [Desulfomonilaceae bacterium]
MLELSFDKRLAHRSILEADYLESKRLLKAWTWKSSLEESFPLLVSLIGGTGTGKSTVFNSLAGEIISKVGHKRPSTLRAIILAPQHAARKIAECPLPDSEAGPNNSLLRTQIVAHHRSELSKSILVDTPDIDSIEPSNRLNAESFFIISDIIIFVTSQEKYGDLAVHEVTERARRWGKKTIFIMNKVTSATAFDDFRNSLKAEKFIDEPVRIDRLPIAPEIIPGLREDPHFSAIFGEVAEKNFVKNIREAELERLSASTRSSLEMLEQSFDAEHQRIATINSGIQVIFEDVTRNMQADLDRVVTPDVEKHIRERLNQLTVKYDLLFVPRQKLREAIHELIENVSSWFSFQSSQAPDKQAVIPDRFGELDAVRRAANLRPLETAVAQLNKRVAQMLSSDPGLSDICQVALAEVPRWHDNEIHELYHDAFPGVEKLLEAEFKRFKDGLPVSDQVKLYGWSGLWAAFVIAMEIVVGGGFTLLDALLNTAILPSIPTLVLKAKLAGFLRDIGERVDLEQRRTLEKILKKQAEMYMDKFAGLLPPRSKLEDLAGIRASIAP